MIRHGSMSLRIRVGPMVLTEAMINDEEKVDWTTAEDAMSHESRHMAPRTRVE